MLTRPTTRITQLDGVRAIAIIAVFLNHGLFVRLLWSGVDLFFVLSGFLITGILLGQKHRSALGPYLRHFYGRRARRILPPYLLLLALTTLFFGAGWMRHIGFYLFGMNLLKGWGIPYPEPLGLLWSLAVEEQFYFFWPFVVFWCGKETVARVAAAVLVLAPALRWFCTPYFAVDNIWPMYQWTPFRMDCLAAGAVLALVWHRHRHWIERFGLYGLGLSAMAAAALLYLRGVPGYLRTDNTPQGNTALYELTLLASVGIVLWALSGRFVAPLQWQPLRYLGRISYTVYLVHLLALVLAGRFLHGTFAIAALAAALTVAYAALSWRFLEQPLLGTRPKEATVVLAPALDSKS